MPMLSRTCAALMFLLGAAAHSAPVGQTATPDSSANLIAPQVAAAARGLTSGADTVNRVVLTWDSPEHAAAAMRRDRQQPRSVTARSQSASAAVPHTMTPVKAIGDRSVAYNLNQPLSVRQIRLMSAQLSPANGHDGLIRIEPDVPVQSHSLPTYDRNNKPSDPYFNTQWNLDASSASVRGGANFFGAWIRQTSALPIAIGVIDTGYYPNNDLTGRETLGYDFVSDADLAGDGDGRDADPISPGVYCSSPLASIGAWHGMQVSEQMAANPDNDTGIIGAAWRNARVLQVRAIGSCNGHLSDVADALRWTAGETIDGVPANSTAVRVINLSLGGQTGGGCPVFMQEAVNAAVNKGIVVVASAGNDGLNTLSAPANCQGVISVGAHTRSGDLAVYSNHQSLLTLTAPAGGKCLTQTNCQDSGLPAWTPDRGYISMGGTSIAAPQVSATVALMLAEAPTLTPARVAEILRQTAVKHVAGSYCANTPGECGAGMLNAAAALAAVADPTLTVQRSPSSASVPGNSRVSLSASLLTNSGTDNPALYRYVWQQTAGTPTQLSANDTASVNLTTPATRSGGPLRWMVTATRITDGTPFTSSTELRLDTPPSIRAQSDPATWGCRVGLPCTGQLSLSDADGDAVVAVQLAGPDGALAQDGRITLTPADVSQITVQAVALTPDSGLRGEPITLNIPVAGSSQPAPTASGGGGGGSVNLLSLLLGLLACAALGGLRRDSALKR